MKPFGLALIACLMLVACSERTSESAPQDTAATNQAKPNLDAPTASSKTRPALEVQTFDGKPFKLADYRDKWVIVNFWATWCAPCLKEIPDFNAFAKSRSDVQFIGLAYEEITQADMQAFLQKHPIDYPFAILDVYNPPADFETPRGLPMTVLIAPGGEVAKTFLGPVTSADLAAEMAKKNQ
jgi:thiol-disulfide isomerase/thioredoxin